MSEKESYRQGQFHRLHTLNTGIHYFLQKRLSQLTSFLTITSALLGSLDVFGCFLTGESIVNGEINLFTFNDNFINAVKII